MKRAGLTKIHLAPSVTTTYLRQHTSFTCSIKEDQSCVSVVCTKIENLVQLSVVTAAWEVAKLGQTVFKIALVLIILLLVN